MTFRQLFYDVLNLCFPRKCPVCGGRLFAGESICVTCLTHMPFTMLHRYPNNHFLQRLSCRIPIEKASAYFFYSPQSSYHNIIHHIKYKGNRSLGVGMGRLYATHLCANGNFFEGIDVIIPVPLHKSREEKRGYNQSMLLAQGINEVVGIPVVSDAIIRVVDNPTQTHLSDTERWENVKDIFCITSSAKQQLRGKHLLLVDDVSTTGATLASCAEVLSKNIPQCRISISVLGVTELNL